MSGSRLLWAVILGFLAGVLVRSFVPLGLSYALFLSAVTGVLLLALFFFDRERFRMGTVIAIGVFAFAIGIVRMNTAILPSDPVLQTHIKQHVTLTGYVFAEPDVREAGTRISIRSASITIGSSTAPVHAGVLAVLPPHTHVAYGDEVHVSGTLRTPTAFDTGLGRSFNYPAYLAVSGITYQLSSAHIDAISGNSGNAIYTQVISIKESFIRGLGAVLPEPESGLAAGITVGDKRSIGPQLSADFQRASLIHMLVLSGYNITVILNAATYLTGWLPRIAQFGMSGFVVVFFMLLSGGASSAVRAGLMALIAVYARQHGRTYLALRAIGLVAVVMALWNPYIVAFDPSFQLSALATIGLVAFTPIFATRMQWVTKRWGLREVAASTLGTQLVVLPLILFQSGQLSLVALPANILALAPVPFAMLVSSIAALLGIVFGSTATLLVLPAYILLAYIITITHFFGSLPFAAVTLGAFSAWWLAGAYAILFLVWHFYNKKKSDLEAALL